MFLSSAKCSCVVNVPPRAIQLFFTYDFHVKALSVTTYYNEKEKYALALQRVKCGHSTSNGNTGILADLIFKSRRVRRCKPNNVYSRDHFVLVVF
jgi:hypothetical protein